MKKMNKVCSLILSLALLLTMVPTALAATPFTDVVSGSWYEPYVDYCYANGLMNGTSGTKFEPDLKMSRAMLVTVLYRAAGEPSFSGSHPFTDVPSGAWFEEAVTWAYENSVVNGTSSTTFSPDEDISREAMVTIFFRFAAAEGYDVSNAADLAVFADSAKTSPWAADALKWAVADGIINGKSETELAPQGTANRAECAAVIQRYVQWTAGDLEVVPIDPSNEFEPDPTKDYSDPYTAYVYPMCDYDAVVVRDNTRAYGESLGMTHVDLSNEVNVPASYTVAYDFVQTLVTFEEAPSSIEARIKQAIDDACVLMEADNCSAKYFHVELRENKMEDTYVVVVRFLHPVTEVSEPTTTDGSIDIAALEQYGRDYAYATYGFDGNPNCNKETNASWYPASDRIITTMAEGCAAVRAKIDLLYNNLVRAQKPIYGAAPDGRIGRMSLNIQMTACENDVYTIFAFYSGTSEDYHLDYWK